MAIPFEIPAPLFARYLAGDLIRNGTLLREAGTGRIVAHLQETAGVAGLAGSGLSPGSMIADGVQIYQNEQIKAGIALIGRLQVANLALTGVGIGVTIAGFAIIAGKLDRIEARLGEIGVAIEQIARRVKDIQEHLIRSQLAALRAELRRIDEAWSRTDAEAQWRIAADHLLTLEQTFFDHARSLNGDTDEGGLREQMVDAFAIAGGGRISALLAAREEDVAGKAGHHFARSLSELTGAIGAPQLLRDMLACEQTPLGSAARLKAIERLRPEAEQRAMALREREEAAATAPLTIAALACAGLTGREWLARARGEIDAPLICLSVAETKTVTASDDSALAVRGRTH
jgi:hypothetical protein